jgi:hypothetical protein
MKNIITIFGSCLLLLWAGLALGHTPAENAPDITVSLELASPIPGTTYQGLPVYYPGQALPFKLTFWNRSGEIITSKGFSDREFRLLLVFTDPKGTVITTDQFPISKTPPAARVFVGAGGTLIPGDPIETLKPGWGWQYDLPDARTLYPLQKGGIYQVRAVIPMRTCSSYSQSGSVNYSTEDRISWTGKLESNAVLFTLVADFDQDGYYYPLPAGTLHPNQADCDDENQYVHPGAVEIMGNGLDDDCNPATLDALPTGTLRIRAEMHTVGPGNKPTSKKEPLNLSVKIFETGIGSCADRFGTSWQNYQSIWSNCSIPTSFGLTGSDGIGNFSLTPGNYIVIGLYDPDINITGNEIYMGVSVGTLNANQTKEKYLQLIVTSDGKKVPAKYTVKTGSQLLIIEPEYIEWDGTQELYPFIFESIGDWGVTTSVSPPEGFVADKPILATEVNNDQRALQFVITDIGSKWVHTKVEHRIKHKGGTETVRSQVGIKLSERLAGQKGLGRFGDEDLINKH